MSARKFDESLYIIIIYYLNFKASQHDSLNKLCFHNFNYLRKWNIVGIDEINGIYVFEQLGELVQRLHALQAAELVGELDLEQLFDVIGRILIDIDAEIIDRVDDFLKYKRLFAK